MYIDDAFDGLKHIIKKCWQTSEDKGWHQESHLYRKYKKLATNASNIEHLDAINSLLYVLGGERTEGVPVMSKLMLICTEVAEAAEVFRDVKKFPSLQECYEQRENDTYFMPYRDDRVSPLTGEKSPLPKPEGFGSELADIVIRVFDLAEDLGIDLAAEIKRKMLFNESRAYRHGGKVA